MALQTCNPVLGVEDKRVLGAPWPASPAEMVSFWLSDQPCMVV